MLSCSETVELGRSDSIGECDPDGPQCSDCADNDNDGLVDGFDPECSGAQDDDEGSFSTGIPGDNQNSGNQDCFFDGNSGSGNDGCDLHPCCILDLGGGGCPADLKPQDYDSNDCGVTSQCVENCEPLVPPGCDCFGCCTVCEGANCVDIAISPALSPDCDSDNLDDPDACLLCIKNTDCSSDCDPENCIACPGQSADDLPAGCTPTCPERSTVCSASAPCPAGQFCANGCCIGVPQ